VITFGEIRLNSSRRCVFPINDGIKLVTYEKMIKCTHKYQNTGMMIAFLVYCFVMRILSSCWCAFDMQNKKIKRI